MNLIILYIITFNKNFFFSKYTDIYEKAENEAKGKKLGMWAYGEGGIVAGGVTGWKELKESRVEVCSDISNHEVFYLQNSGHKVKLNYLAFFFIY